MSAAEDQEIEAQLIAHNYAQAPIALYGSAGAALIIAAFIARDGFQTALYPWLAGHAIVTLAGLAVLRRWRNGTLPNTPRVARIIRRVRSICFGALWASAGLLWPLSTGNTGIGVLLSTSGLAAAASATSAADPWGTILFCLVAFAPPLAIAAPQDAWLSGLLILYLTAIIIVSFRNHQVLKLSFSLRLTNKQLLEQSRAEHEATLVEKRRAESAVAARTRFIAAASHDLRQPVQALSLFADVLAHQTSEDKRAEVIAALGRTSQALSAMLESLLDISRLDAGIAAPNPTSLPVQRLLEDIASGLAGEAEARDMVIQVAGRPCQVWCDRTMLARVVQNLAVNAVRHGGGRVLISTRKRGDRCLLQVWDQGPGIAERDRERIFEELVQLENPERDRNKGLGLGLSMVRRLCELNEWPIAMQSRVGRGTVFSITLPLAPSEPNVFPRNQPQELQAFNVLLVEDDPDVREATRSWLESRGCKLVTAGDGAQALAAFHRQRAIGAALHILITDHGLPGELSGADLALRLRQDDPHLPVVIVTGAEHLPFDAKPPAGVVVLRKPVKGEVLWRTVRDMLDVADTSPVRLDGSRC